MSDATKAKRPAKIRRKRHKRRAAAKRAARLKRRRKKETEESFDPWPDTTGLSEEEAAKAWEEFFFWEDYYDRNST